MRVWWKERRTERLEACIWVLPSPRIRSVTCGEAFKLFKSQFILHKKERLLWGFGEEMCTKGPICKGTKILITSIVFFTLLCKILLSEPVWYPASYCWFQGSWFLEFSQLFIRITPRPSHIAQGLAREQADLMINILYMDLPVDNHGFLHASPSLYCMSAVM